MAGASEKNLFTAEDVTEALKDVVSPEVVTALLADYLDRRRIEHEELQRMERMVAIIDRYDELLLLENEGGCTLTLEPIRIAADDYLASTQEQPSKNALDRKARITSLKILAESGSIRSTDASVGNILRSLPHIEEIRAELNRQGFAVNMKEEG